MDGMPPEVRYADPPEGGHGSRLETRLYLLLATSALAYVLARAVLVPFVHDEARSFFLFIRTGDVLPHQGPMDAANHILHSCVTRLLYLLFGPSPWVLRGFGVSSFLLYAFYIHRIGEMIRVRLVRWCAWTALLFTPFVIEFFSLSRGYGPSIAFLLMSFWHGRLYVLRRNAVHLALCLLALTFAAYCNLALLLPWAGAGILLAFLSFRGKARPAMTVLSALLLLLAIAAWCYLASFAFELGSRGELYYGATDPWYGTLGRMALRLTGFYEPWIIAIPVLLCAAHAAVRMVRDMDSSMGEPLVLLMLFVLFDMLGRWFMHVFLGTPLPLDRTALHWMPLLVLALALVFDHAAQDRAWARFVAFVLLYLPAFSAVHANTRSTRLWPDQCVDGGMVREIAMRVSASDSPMLLHADEFKAHALAYEALWREVDLPLVYRALPPGPAYDLLIVDEIPEWSRTHYDAVYRSPLDGSWLLARRWPAAQRIEVDTFCTATGTTYMDLFVGDPWGEHAGPLYIDVDLRLVENVRYKGYLVVEVRHENPDEHGHHFKYGQELRLLDQATSGRPFRIRFGLPERPPSRGDTHLFLWDPDNIGMVVVDCRIRIRVPVAPWSDPWSPGTFNADTPQDHR